MNSAYDSYIATDVFSQYTRAQVQEQGFAAPKAQQNITERCRLGCHADCYLDERRYAQKCNIDQTIDDRRLTMGSISDFQLQLGNCSAFTTKHKEHKGFVFFVLCGELFSYKREQTSMLLRPTLPHENEWAILGSQFSVLFSP